MPIPNRNHGVSLHQVRDLLLPGIRSIQAAVFGDAALRMTVDLLTLFPDDTLAITFRCGDWNVQHKLFSRAQIDDGTYKEVFNDRVTDFLKRCEALIS